ncbi:MAG TPA: hypothetical protein VJ440_06460 [Candidatus Brocadiaceae bacterium]|nr:hypothetical protein [Candidatus Brocadiaceae bacterium]
MSISTLKTKIFKEIHLIPDGKIEELYDVIHYFRIGLETSEGEPRQIMEFAGCWNDMSEKTFAGFSQEIHTRRQRAFSRRRNRETGAD